MLLLLPTIKIFESREEISSKKNIKVNLNLLMIQAEAR
jgi:hypothetical protein